MATDCPLNHLTADILQCMWPGDILKIPSLEVGGSCEQVFGDPGTFVQEPLCEIEHVGPGLEQSQYTLHLMLHVLRVQLGAQRANAEVEWGPAPLVNNVHVAVSAYEQLEDAL